MKFQKGHIPWNKNIPCKKETKRKLSKALKSRFEGKNNPFYGKHHSVESKRRMSESSKGQISGFIGKKHTKESKQKMRKPHLTVSGMENPAKRPEVKKKIGIANSKIQKEKWKDPKYRKRMSDAHKGNHYPKMSLAKRGKNVDYKNIARLHRAVRNCWQYKEWRMKILKRDDFICMLCSQRGGKLEVDHYPKSFVKIMEDNYIKSLEEALECNELWSLINNRTLCKKCHLFLRKKKHV